MPGLNEEITTELVRHLFVVVGWWGLGRWCCQKGFTDREDVPCMWEAPSHTLWSRIEQKRKRRKAAKCYHSFVLTFSSAER